MKYYSKILYEMKIRKLGKNIFGFHTGKKVNKLILGRGEKGKKNLCAVRFT